MIITCPHCQTKYQVTYEAIGSAGRKVQCAQCQQAWQQAPLDMPAPTPEEKRAFEVILEDSLDEAMEAEARNAAAEKPRPEKPAEQAAARPDKKPGKKPKTAQSSQQQQQAYVRRRSAMEAHLPLARLRRAMRLIAALMLAAIVGGAYFGRVEVVKRFPSMAGVYDAVGLGVNVIGLEFADVTTLHTRRDGQEILLVSAQIVGLRPAPVHVPPVVVTLVDDHGRAIYEWSVTTSVRDLMGGERARFDTQLVLPPGAAKSVRLSFSEGTAPTRAGVGAQVQSSGNAQNQEYVLAGQAAAPAEPSQHSPAPEHH